MDRPVAVGGVRDEVAGDVGVGGTGWDCWRSRGRRPATVLAALQVHLVQAQAADHSRRRRCCQRCGAQRPFKDHRSRRLMSLFGMVGVARRALPHVDVR